MLTSREDLLNTSNNSHHIHEEEKKSKEARICSGAQSRDQRGGISAPTPTTTTPPTPRTDDICAHMETAAANSQTTTVKCTQQKFSPAPSPSPRIIMGEGKEETSEQLAATKIQAGFRGYQVRKQMKTKKPSSDNKETKRCNSGRRRNSGRAKDGQKSSDLEERSATKIQAGIRGFLVRKRQNKTKEQI